MTVNDLVDLLLDYPGWCDVVVAVEGGDQLEIRSLTPRLVRGEPCKERKISILTEPVSAEAASLR